MNEFREKQALLEKEGADITLTLFELVDLSRAMLVSLLPPSIRFEDPEKIEQAIGMLGIAAKLKLPVKNKGTNALQKRLGERAQKIVDLFVTKGKARS